MGLSKRRVGRQRKREGLAFVTEGGGFGEERSGSRVTILLPITCKLHSYMGRSTTLEDRDQQLSHTRPRQLSSLSEFRPVDPLSRSPRLLKPFRRLLEVTGVEETSVGSERRRVGGFEDKILFL
jgi:hypothetical protein